MSFVNQVRNSGPIISNLVKALGVLGFAGWIGSNSYYNVEAGHRSFLFNRIGGIGETTYTEGIHFMLPWFHRPIIYDIRTRPKSIDSLTGSKDLQMVQITLRILFKPDRDHLQEIYRKLGMDFDVRVLPSIVNEILKAVIARYNAAELLTKRELVSKEVAHLLTERARDFHIILDDVSITHLDFSPQYRASVEAKQVAQQDAERAKYVVEKAIQEKRTIKAKALGEAESARLIGNSIRENPGFIQLRRLSVANEIADIVSASNNKLFLSSDSLMVDLMSGSDQDMGTKLSKRR
jgi:prohibitin 2